MNVLTICQWGQRRSKHLATYLQEKGHTTACAGVDPRSENRVTQELVDWAEVLVFVQPEIERQFDTFLDGKEKKRVTLDVKDIPVPWSQDMSPEEWGVQQKEGLFRELEKQMEDNLPL